MSLKHKALAEAIASFEPKFAVLEQGAEDPLPAPHSLEDVLDKMTALLVNQKALYQPVVTLSDGEFEAHQLLIGEHATKEGQKGEILFRCTIHLRKYNGAPIDSAAIAHGIIACVCNAARILTEAHAANEASRKKDMPTASTPAADSSGSAGGGFGDTHQPGHP